MELSLDNLREKELWCLVMRMLPDLKERMEKQTGEGRALKQSGLCAAGKNSE